MKKQLSFLIIAALVIAGICSCKKLVDTFFSGETFNLPRLTFTMPIIPAADSTEFGAGSFTTHINIDSTIRAKTGGTFGINALSTAKIQQAQVRVLNADADNNLSAIKSFRITISSNDKATPMDMITINVPATAFDTYTEIPANGTNIVDYMHGTEITNGVYGRVRKTTTKQLKVELVLTLFVK